jgi:GINS complex subunit 2
VPLWLALLLKKQRRANVVPPPWLDSDSLTLVLQIENEQEKEAFSPGPPLPRVGTYGDPISPPFVPSSTIDSRTRALPYHWMEMGEILLEAAADDFRDADKVRSLLRDLREARLAKLRAGIEVLDAAGGVQMNGVGGMEIAEGRAFICGVIDGLRFVQYHHIQQLANHLSGKSVLQENWPGGKEKWMRITIINKLRTTMTMTICFNDSCIR